MATGMASGLKKFYHKCSRITTTAWWQHAVSKLGTPLFKSEGKAAYAVVTMFLIYFWQHAVPSQEHCGPSVLSVGRQEGHPACKNFLLQNPLHEAKSAKTVVTCKIKHLQKCFRCHYVEHMLKIGVVTCKIKHFYKFLRPQHGREKSTALNIFANVLFYM